MPKYIIHISDTHFGDNDSPYNIISMKKSLISSINNLEGIKILVISGDIIFKGNITAYTQAKIFFNEIISSCNIPKSHVIACPGNHDICQGDLPFKGFDEFIYALRKDNKISFTKNNSVLLNIENISILLINSVSHLEHSYGLIPNSAFEVLDERKKEIDIYPKKIIVTHHHLIGQEKYDISTTRNAYGLLYHANKLKYNYILHGHQHSNQDFIVGQNSTNIISARSMKYHDRGYLNGFNVINIEQNTTNKILWTLDEEPGKTTASIIK